MIDDKELDSVIVRAIADKYGIDISDQNKKIENFLNKIGPLIEQNKDIHKLIGKARACEREAWKRSAEKAHKLTLANEIILFLSNGNNVPLQISEAVRVALKMREINIKYNNDGPYLEYPKSGEDFEINNGKLITKSKH